MSGTVALDVLNRVEVASPCTADWGSMRGNERVRDCPSCGMRVYNLSEMSREQAAALVQRSEGRLCVRFYRRADGTLITRDCPVGLRALQLKAAAGVARTVAAAALVAGSVVSMGIGRPWWSLRLRNVQPFARICEWIRPSPKPVIAPSLSRGTQTVLMGARIIRPLPIPTAAPASSCVPPGGSQPR